MMHTTYDQMVAQEDREREKDGEKMPKISCKAGILIPFIIHSFYYY